MNDAPEDQAQAKNGVESGANGEERSLLEQESQQEERLPDEKPERREQEVGSAIHVADDE